MKAAKRIVYHWSRRELRAERHRYHRARRTPRTPEELALVDQANAKRARRGALRLQSWTGART